MLDWLLGALLVLAFMIALYGLLKGNGGSCNSSCGKDCRQCAAGISRKTSKQRLK